MEWCNGSEEVTLVVLDIKDAFMQVSVHEAERRFIAGRAWSGVFVYASYLGACRDRDTESYTVHGHVHEQIELLRGRHALGHQCDLVVASPRLWETTVRIITAQIQG